MIDASVELQERERTKLAAITAAICAALQQRQTDARRGVDVDTCSPGAAEQIARE
ncbi:hypothetical protein ABZY10_29335 [Streptomyces sp. NPDC006539]|uniref:hypothetical protein n=1 Tax=Streptomyces sp. NPDC006539 TaxID=3155352 RepID=UPI0033AA5AA9